jgi:hypothetical protein
MEVSAANNRDAKHIGLTLISNNSYFTLGSNADLDHLCQYYNGSIARPLIGFRSFCTYQYEIDAGSSPLGSTESTLSDRTFRLSSRSHLYQSHQNLKVLLKVSGG